MDLLVALLRALGACFADALAPPTCAACDARLRRSAVFCAPCARAVLRGGAAPRGAGPPIVAFALYGGPVAEALRRLKYGARPDSAAPLGHLARCAVREGRVEADSVVPVPLHPARLAERGYNQAALLGGHVARELGVPMAARGLVRTRDTPQQARLDRAERLLNVGGAFRAASPARLRDLRVVLVDDVATTGATLAACGVALLGAGAASVTAVVVARADQRGGAPTRSDAPAC